MKRKLFAFMTALTLLLNVVLVASVSAHTARIAGTFSDPLPAEPDVPDLFVDFASLPTEVAPGGQVCYDITYGYSGGVASATNVQIVQTLPPALTFASQSSGQPAVVGAATLTWHIGVLAAGGQLGRLGNVCLNMSTGVSVGTKLNTSITISGTNEDPDATANNTAARSLTVSNTPNLAVHTSGLPSSVRSGQQFTFDIVYANNGAVDATNVTLTDVLPAGVTFIGVAESDPSPATSGQTLTWSFASLPKGTTGSITVIVKLTGTVSEDQTLTNTLSISGTPDDIASAQGDNTETKTLTVSFLKLYLPHIIR